MTAEQSIPEMRAFVMSLLVVATGDTRTLPDAVNIVFNAAFRYGLEVAAGSPELARRATRGDSSLGGWLDRGGAGNDFFLTCGQLLDAVDRRVRGRHDRFASSPADAPSSYDHAALMALGQTLFQAAGVRRANVLPADECFSRIAAANPRECQRTFLTNYLGNVLQDYFDASQVRAEFASLPADTERSLRTEEATALANAVFAALGGGTSPVDTTALQREFRSVIGRVWLAERSLDD